MPTAWHFGADHGGHVGLQIKRDNRQPITLAFQQCYIALIMLLVDLNRSTGTINLMLR